MKFIEKAVPTDKSTCLSYDMFLALLQLIGHPDVITNSKDVLSHHHTRMMQHFGESLWADMFKLHSAALIQRCIKDRTGILSPNSKV